MVAVDSVNVIIKAEDKASSVFNRVNKNAQSKFAGIGRAAKTAGIAIAAIGAIAAVGIGKAISKASDFEETLSKFNVVFSEVSDRSAVVAKDLQENFGLSGLAAKSLLSNTGDLLTGFGVAGDKALQMSEDVNKLAVDLASFTNATGGAEAVSQALTKALLGERESLKTYGIAIVEADIKADLLARGMDHLTGEALRQAKADSTLIIATRQSKNAVGDFARTQGSFANQLRTARARLEDVGVELGTVFLPIASQAITKVADFISGLRGFSEEGTVFRETMEVIGAKTKFAFDLIGVAFETVKGVFEENGSAIKETLGTIGDIIKNISSAVLDTFTVVASVIGEALQAVFNVFMKNKDTIMETFEIISGVVKGVFGGIKTFFEENKDFIVGVFESLAQTVVSIFGVINAAVKTVKSIWDSNFLGIADKIRTVIAFTKFLGSVVVETFGGIVDTLSFLSNNWNFMWNSMKLSTFNAVNSIVDRIQGAVNSIIALINVVPGIEIDEVDLTKFKVDTELLQAKVQRDQPTESLTETLAPRAERLGEAGVRLFDDLKAIETEKENREIRKEAEDQRLLEEFRASKTEVNITGDTIIQGSTLSADEIAAMLDERDRVKLIEGGVPVI